MKAEDLNYFARSLDKTRSRLWENLQQDRLLQSAEKKIIILMAA